MNLSDALILPVSQLQT